MRDAIRGSPASGAPSRDQAATPAVAGRRGRRGDVRAARRRRDRSRAGAGAARARDRQGSTERARLEGQKLANPDFVERAPDEVVEQQRERVRRARGARREAERGAQADHLIRDIPSSRRRLLRRRARGDPAAPSGPCRASSKPGSIRGRRTSAAGSRERASEPNPARRPCCRASRGTLPVRSLVGATPRPLGIAVAAGEATRRRLASGRSRARRTGGRGASPGRSPPIGSSATNRPRVRSRSCMSPRMPRAAARPPSPRRSGWRAT